MSLIDYFTRLVGRIKQTVAAPELQSQIAAVVCAQCVFEYKPVCAATAWLCDLGPAYVKYPGSLRP